MTNDTFEDARILVVDDQEANVLLMTRILAKSGFTNITTTTDPREALSLYEKTDPDLIILDLLMPHLDGFEIMERLAKVVPDGTYLPILVLTADLTPGAMHRALSMGARDFLHKPFDPVEVVLRIRNLLETRFMYVRLQDQFADTERKVEERTERLRRELDRAIELAEYRRRLLARLMGADLTSSPHAAEVD